MFQPYQLSYLYLLHEQHGYYTSLLGDSHQSLSKEYRKLAGIQLELAQRHDTQMPRHQKKKLQWTRSKVKNTIKDLERQQERLQESLRQCGDLIASYAQRGGVATNHTQIPYPIAPFPTMPPMPWVSSAADVEEQPKYWDLSMLRERGGSTVSIPSADSGFHEPSILSEPLVPAYTNKSSFQPRHISFQSDTSVVGPFESIPSPAKAGPVRQRCYSENAIQLIESRFASSSKTHRVRSVEQIPAFDRVGSLPAAIQAKSLGGFDSVVA